MYFRIFFILFYFCLILFDSSAVPRLSLLKYQTYLNIKALKHVFICFPTARDKSPKNEVPEAGIPLLDQPHNNEPHNNGGK